MRHSATQARFLEIAEGFAGRPTVELGGNKGFGGNALKASGKIFAMVSSRDEFVLKLPAVHVRELLESGAGRPFDAGKGKPMKEWIVIGESADWRELAEEAYRFASGR